MKILVDMKWVVNPDDGAWELYKGYTNVDNHFRTSGIEWEKVTREGTYQVDRGYETVNSRHLESSFPRQYFTSGVDLGTRTYSWDELMGVVSTDGSLTSG